MAKALDRPATRDRLIDATVELLREKGPSASGTAEILQRAETPRGSFYFHFPGGKDELVAAAIGRHGVHVHAGLELALADGARPLPERVTRWIEGIARATEADGFRLGCAVASTALEVPVSSPLREATEVALATWTSSLADRLVDEGVAAERAVAVADAVIAGLEGATMMARARRDAAPLHNVAVTLGSLVETALADARPPEV